MSEDGLYLNHGPDRCALVVIRQDEGKTLWIRDFATVNDALNILEDDVLSLHERTSIQEALVGNKGFFTKEVLEPEDGYAGCAFRRYVLEPVR